METNRLAIPLPVALPDLFDLTEDGAVIGKLGLNDVFRYGSKFYLLHRETAEIKLCPDWMVEEIFTKKNQPSFVECDSES